MESHDKGEPVLGKSTRVLVLAVAFVVVFANAAFAVGNITTPASNPFNVPGNAAGQPQSFTIAATGFGAGALVKVQICDGLPASNPQWDVTLDCDLGTQTAGQSSPGATSTLTFTAGDINFGIKPFKGSSPQGQFTCYTPTQWPTASNGTTDPATLLPAWNNCQIRVASSLSDQTFSTMILPDAIVASAPVPQNQAITVATGSVTTITLSATPDPANATNGYQLTQLPATGTVSVNGNPAALNTAYSPNNGQSLDIVFTAPPAASIQSLKFQARDAAFAFGAGGTGTVTVTVGSAPADQGLNQQVNGGQLVLSCNAPGSAGYPLLTCPSVTLTPAVTLDGTQQTTGGAMSSLYVSDNRGDLTANWSLTSYMVPTSSVTGCSTANFCNSAAGADLTLQQNHIAAANLSLTPSGCVAFGSNLNPERVTPSRRRVRRKPYRGLRRDASELGWHVQGRRQLLTQDPVVHRGRSVQGHGRVPRVMTMNIS